jgi:hypothetical protein
MARVSRTLLHTLQQHVEEPPAEQGWASPQDNSFCPLSKLSKPAPSNGRIASATGCNSTFLHTLHIYRVFDLPCQSQTVPLAAILADIGNAWEHNVIRAKLVQWYWNGGLGELYGFAAASRFSRDFLEVPPWQAGGPEPTPSPQISPKKRHIFHRLSTKRGCLVRTAVPSRVLRLRSALPLRGQACPGCVQIARGCGTFNPGVSRSYLHGGFADKSQSLYL